MRSCADSRFLWEKDSHNSKEFKIRDTRVAAVERMSKSWHWNLSIISHLMIYLSFVPYDTQRREFFLSFFYLLGTPYLKGTMRACHYWPR